MTPVPTTATVLRAGSGTRLLPPSHDRRSPLGLGQLAAHLSGERPEQYAEDRPADQHAPFQGEGAVSVEIGLIQGKEKHAHGSERREDRGDRAAGDPVWPRTLWLG